MKLFHVGDVITVATYRLVSPGYIDGLCDFLEFLTGERPFTHQISRFIKECQPGILRQYPQFSLPAFQQAIDVLIEITKSDVSCKEQVDEWLIQIMSGEHGVLGLPLQGPAKDMLEVHPMSPGHHERIDPESELLEKMPAHRIISI